MMCSGIIPYDISDNFPVFCLTGYTRTKPKTKEPLRFKHRPIDNDALMQIRSSLMDIDWSYLLTLDVNAAYSDFKNTLNIIIGEFAPEKEVVIPTKYVLREEWMTRGLMKSSSTLNKLYKKCLRKPRTDPSYIRYLNFRNKYNKLKRTAKHEYYQQRFDQNKHDIKGTWKLLNSLIGRQNDKSSVQSNF
jgi:hypothetical protein